MPEFILKMTLISDGAFGSGSGMNSLVDMEVKHDRYGCPFMSGRTLKGLLAEECANILYSLGKQNARANWMDVAMNMFGASGSDYGNENTIRFGNAQLPEALHAAIRYEVKRKTIAPDEVFKSLTAVRFQTAVAFESGVAKTKSLRSKRVIMRETPFEARLQVNSDRPEPLQLLSACVKTLRRVGVGRNRGTGEIRLRLFDSNDDITDTQYQLFLNAIGTEGRQ